MASQETARESPWGLVTLADFQERNKALENWRGVEVSLLDICNEKHLKINGMKRDVMLQSQHLNTELYCWTGL